MKLWRGVGGKIYLWLQLGIALLHLCESRARTESIPCHSESLQEQPRSPGGAGRASPAARRRWAPGAGGAAGTGRDGRAQGLRGSHLPAAARSPGAAGRAMRGRRPPAMFGAGRYSIPRPVTRNLEDLDSVQSVLLHRSVPGTGGGGRLAEIASRAREAPGSLSLRRAQGQRSHRIACELPFCGGGTGARGRVLPPGAGAAPVCTARDAKGRERKGRGGRRWPRRPWASLPLSWTRGGRAGEGSYGTTPGTLPCAEKRADTL